MIVGSSLKSFFGRFPSSSVSFYFNARNVSPATLVSIAPSSWPTTVPASLRLHSLFNSRELYSSSRNSAWNGPKQEKKMPELMTNSSRFLQVPDMFKSINNNFFKHPMLKPYFDADFTLAEFLRGAKQAIQFISNKISDGDIQSLVQLCAVSKDALREIERNLYHCPPEQRKLLTVHAKDITSIFLCKVNPFIKHGDIYSCYFSWITPFNDYSYYF